MGPVSYLGELSLLALVGVGTALLLSKLRLPAAAGFLAAGALVGPYGFGLVQSASSIDALAEVGVVLLLFTIGLEFSYKRLQHIARLVVVGGLLQVGLTVLGVSALALALGESMPRAIFFGFILSLSSTAIVLRVLADKNETDAPHGRITVGTLIFQDLCVVPMVLLVPVLAGKGGGDVVLGVALALGKAVLLVVLAIGLARTIVPWLYRLVDRTRSREIFLLFTIGVCIGIAWLTSLAGLSLALGAFLAGMVLADTDYAHRALTDVLPLRDVFTSLFFISLGMLFDGRLLLLQPLWIALLLGGLMLGKSLVATLAALAMHFPARVAILAGLGLAQFSEFGFVLANLGEQNGLLGVDETRTLLLVGSLSMFLTPLLMQIAPHLTAGERLLRPLERHLGVQGIDEPAPEHGHLRDHVILVGYGIAGRLMAKALVDHRLPYLVLELNAETVRVHRSQGLPIYYGDVTSPEVLQHAQIERARALVLMINDPQAARRAIANAKRVAPHIAVLVRTRYIRDHAQLLQMGTQDVVVEELEAGMEMMARVLRKVGLPRNLIADRIRDAREGTLESQRRPTFPRPSIAEVPGLAELKVESFFVRDGCHACGKTPVGMQLRSKTGALVVAIRRQGALLLELGEEQYLQPGDTLFLVGDGAAIRSAIDLLEGADGPEKALASG